MDSNRHIKDLWTTVFNISHLVVNIARLHGQKKLDDKTVVEITDYLHKAKEHIKSEYLTRPEAMEDNQ